MTLKAHGVDALGRMVAQNVRQAQDLAQRIEAHPDLELLAPVGLNVVCFRLRRPESRRPPSTPSTRKCWCACKSAASPSLGTFVGGRYALRVANVNHRSRSEDFQTLLEAVPRLGREVLAEPTLPASPRMALLSPG